MKKGFTLIELMISIAIIAILLAFLIPVVASLKQATTDSIKSDTQIEQPMETEKETGDNNL